MLEISYIKVAEQVKNFINLPTNKSGIGEPIIEFGILIPLTLIIIIGAYYSSNSKNWFRKAKGPFIKTLIYSPMYIFCVGIFFIIVVFQSFDEQVFGFLRGLTICIHYLTQDDFLEIDFGKPWVIDNYEGERWHKYLFAMSIVALLIFSFISGYLIDFF